MHKTFTKAPNNGNQFPHEKIQNQLQFCVLCGINPLYILFVFYSERTCFGSIIKMLHYWKLGLSYLLPCAKLYFSNNRKLGLLFLKYLFTLVEIAFMNMFLKHVNFTLSLIKIFNLDIPSSSSSCFSSTYVPITIF